MTVATRWGPPRARQPVATSNANPAAAAFQAVSMDHASGRARVRGDAFDPVAGGRARQLAGAVHAQRPACCHGRIPGARRRRQPRRHAGVRRRPRRRCVGSRGWHGGAKARCTLARWRTPPHGSCRSGPMRCPGRPCHSPAAWPSMRTPTPCRCAIPAASASTRLTPPTKPSRHGACRRQAPCPSRGLARGRCAWPGLPRSTYSVNCVGTATSGGSAALPRRACTISSGLARTSPYAYPQDVLAVTGRGGARRWA